MATCKFRILVVVSWCLLCSVVQSTVAADGDRQKTIEKITAIIDRRVFDGWAENNVFPSARSSDTEFLRRAWLDIAGKIPPAMDVRKFANDKSPSKRKRVIAELLESSRYVVNFTNYWMRILVPDSDDDPRLRGFRPSLENWLRLRLVDGANYDEIAFEILTLDFSKQQQAARNMLQGIGEPTPIFYYMARRNIPEAMASGVARSFLGIRIECAQCHDHPFDDWKRSEFWAFTAFFAGLKPNPNVFSPPTETLGRTSIVIPGSSDNQPLKARLLTGQSPEIPQDRSPRETLAAWIVAPDNPYFARAAVNRIWAHLFGRGLVEPIDDLSDGNLGVHSELLAELAQAFSDSDFDFKLMLQAMMESKSYQLTSHQRNKSKDLPPQLFAIRSVKGLTPDQIYDSLQQATGQFEPFEMNRRVRFGRLDTTGRAAFRNLFRNSSDAPTEVQSTILQALSMMNGKEVSNATAVASSRTLRAVIEFPATIEQRIESLFLTSLSRFPTERELTMMKNYVKSAGDAGWKSALSDVFWALLNSSEFVVNH